MLSFQSEPAPQPQPAPPQKTQLGPQERIDKVLADLQVLIIEVQQFQGSDSKSKDYRYLDEMLTRLMLSLDDVITDGNESLRTARLVFILSTSHLSLLCSLLSVSSSVHPVFITVRLCIRSFIGLTLV